MINIKTIVGGIIGTNCHIIEDGGSIVIIDFVPEIEDVIRKSGYIIDKILITHVHFDHIAFLSMFQKKNKFELYISQSGFEDINNTDNNFMNQIPGLMESYEKISLENAKVVMDKDIIKWKDHEIEVIESPGHSRDSLMYIIHENKTIFSGDTLFYESIGRTDLPGSSHEDILKSIKKLFLVSDDDYSLYPGHGPSSTVGHEKKYNPFL
jgi:hydroxyacylglutathione hydrolase